MCDTLTRRHDGRCYRQQCGGAASQKRAKRAADRAKSVSLAKARADATRLAAEAGAARAEAEAGYHAETRARLSPEKAFAAELGEPARLAMADEYLAAVGRLSNVAAAGREREPDDDDDDEDGGEDPAERWADDEPAETVAERFTREADERDPDAGIAAESLVRVITEPRAGGWMPMPLRALYEMTGDALDVFHELAGRLIALADNPDVLLRDDPSELLGLMVDLVADLEREGESRTAGAPRAARLAVILDRAHDEAFTRSANAETPPQWVVDALAEEKAQKLEAKTSPAATAMASRLPRFYGMTMTQKARALATVKPAALVRRM